MERRWKKRPSQQVDMRGVGRSAQEPRALRTRLVERRASKLLLLLLVSTYVQASHAQVQSAHVKRENCGLFLNGKTQVALPLLELIIMGPM